MTQDNTILSVASEDRLNHYRSAINQALVDYFGSSYATLGLELEGNEKIAFDTLKAFSLRPGKRVRGALSLFAYETFADAPVPSVMNMAIAFELIQNYLLIIDDVTDGSVMRRGEPAMHKLFEKHAGNGAHTAEMLAVTTALLAQHMASALICEIDELAERVQAALAIFHKNIAATGYGQIDDILASLGNPSEQELVRLYELKNSYYTFINPLQTGALLAGITDQECIQKLFNIGLPIGVAFQIQDDIIGLFGEENITGKSTVDDLKEGKRTLLMHYALHKASPDQREVLRSALGNPTITPELHQQVKTIVEDAGARELAEQTARSYCDQALSAVELSGFSIEAKHFLTDIINYAVNRKA